MRPFICRECRRRAQNSLTARIARYASSSIDNAANVERRIADLGGRDVIHKYFPRLKKDQGEKVLSAAYFDGRFRHEYEAMDALKQSENSTISVYGRVASTREHGSKLAFLDISSGRAALRSAQIMLNFKTLQTESGVDLDAFRGFRQQVRRGDWISVRGSPSKTSTGGWTLSASELPKMLSPALQTFPLELSDPEVRIRNRHADLLINTESREIVLLRSILVSQMRAFFLERKFTEVSTPLLSAQAGGATARPFATRATEFEHLQLNLRIAPELWLKRLIAGGMEKVFELGPAFRNEGVDANHNPEFTICEYYAIMNTLEDLMKTTQALFHILAEATKGALNSLTSIQPPKIDFGSTFKSIDFIPALEEAIQVKLPGWMFPCMDDTAAATESLVATFKKLRLQPPATLPRMLDYLSSYYLEPRCKEPTFIMHHPEIMSPLAKSFLSDDGRHRIAARAELFIREQEYVNCYEEENSPVEQRRKFEVQRQLGLGAAGRDEGGQVDESYLSALEWGMPPTGGWGCGVDRIIALFAGKKRIADVLPFGTLRNVVGLGSKAGRERGKARPADSVDDFIKRFERE